MADKYKRTEAEASIIQRFLEPHFGIGFQPISLSEADERCLKEVLGFIADRFGTMRYIMGLGLDFSLLAQQLSNHDPDLKSTRPSLARDDIFRRYELVTQRGQKQANTLTLKFKTQSIGIRKIEESVVDLFGELSRPGYPSAYVYNTGQWQKYQDTLLVPCFQLSESGRFALCNALIDYGLENLKENRFFSRDEPRVRLIEEIIKYYPRTSPNENAGAVFQAIAYGYIKADRPHLSLIVDKSRTGSARQRRFGDIDGYFGIDLEVSVEVKDHEVTKDNVAKELGEFLAKAKKSRVQGLALVLSADEHAEKFTQGFGVACLPLSLLTMEVARWDWRKQDAAVQGILHYLAHVEQNPDAVRRLLAFIQEKDPTHDSLAYYRVGED